jgi:hypothetical protein
MSFFNRGANDKADNKGQADPNKFKSDKERKDYQAGYNKQKEQEQQKKK